MKDDLKRMRTKAGFTQAYVAKLLGYTSPQFVSNWERGMSMPPIETIRNLESIYGVRSGLLYESFRKTYLKDAAAKLDLEFFGK